MERYKLQTVCDNAESRQHIINMALRYLHNCCVRAIEDYSKDPDMFIGMVKGAVENVDKDLGELK